MSENDDIRRESKTCLQKSTKVSSMFKLALLGETS